MRWQKRLLRISLTMQHRDIKSVNNCIRELACYSGIKCLIDNSPLFSLFFLNGTAQLPFRVD